MSNYPNGVRNKDFNESNESVVEYLSIEDVLKSPIEVCGLTIDASVQASIKKVTGYGKTIIEINDLKFTDIYLVLPDANEADPLFQLDMVALENRQAAFLKRIEKAFEQEALDQAEATPAYKWEVK